MRNHENVWFIRWRCRVCLCLPKCINWPLPLIRMQKIVPNERNGTRHRSIWIYNLGLVAHRSVFGASVGISFHFASFVSRSREMYRIPSGISARKWFNSSIWNASFSVRSVTRDSIILQVAVAQREAVHLCFGNQNGPEMNRMIEGEGEEKNWTHVAFSFKLHDADDLVSFVDSFVGISFNLLETATLWCNNGATSTNIYLWKIQRTEILCNVAFTLHWITENKKRNAKSKKWRKNVRMPASVCRFYAFSHKFNEVHSQTCEWHRAESLWLLYYTILSNWLWKGSRRM